MWLTVFIIAAGAALSFSVAAVLLQPRARSAATYQNDRWWGRSSLPLLRRMRSLGLDPAAVARADPLSFWRLEARCRTCDDRERCVRDLRENPAGEVCVDWRVYCPNRPALDMLRALDWYNLRPT